MIYVSGLLEGRRQALSRSQVRPFLIGLGAGVLLAILSIGVAVAVEIPPQANEYKRDLIRLSRSVWGVEAPVASLAAQIHQESMWQPRARSYVGAAGLAQFMPETASWIAREYGDFPNPYDPRWALLYQSRYMKQLFTSIKGAADECERYAFALTAYNGGMGWTNKRRLMSKAPGFCLYQTCDINPGITASNQRENSEYPKRILFGIAPSYVANNWGRDVCTP